MWPSRGTKVVLRRSKSTSVSYVPPIKTRIGSTHLESLIAPSAVGAGPDWLFITCRLTWLQIYCTVNTARINEESRFDHSLINTAAATGHSTQLSLHSVHLLFCVLQTVCTCRGYGYYHRQCKEFASFAGSKPSAAFPNPGTPGKIFKKIEFP